MSSSESSVLSIMDTLTYVSQFSGINVLIKLGGSILQDEALIKTLCDDLRLLMGVGINVVLVHGGSKAINETLAIHRISSEFINGLRVTSKEAMKVIEMVLSGHVNQVLVRRLNAIGLKAIGLSGSDNKMLLCDYLDQEYGFVGKVKQVNTEAIESVLALKDSACASIPVIAPIGVDEQGNALNINADWAAAAIASALKVNKLIYLTDQDGIYDRDGEVISILTAKELNQLIEDEVVKEGMLAKVRAILSAFSLGMDNIHILNGKRPHSLITELFTVNGIGTFCQTRENTFL